MRVVAVCPAISSASRAASAARSASSCSRCSSRTVRAAALALGALSALLRASSSRSAAAAPAASPPARGRAAPGAARARRPPPRAGRAPHPRRRPLPRRPVSAPARARRWPARAPRTAPRARRGFALPRLDVEPAGRQLRPCGGGSSWAATASREALAACPVIVSIACSRSASGSPPARRWPRAPPAQHLGGQPGAQLLGRPPLIGGALLDLGDSPLAPGQLRLPLAQLGVVRAHDRPLLDDRALGRPAALPARPARVCASPAPHARARSSDWRVVSPCSSSSACSRRRPSMSSARSTSRAGQRAPPPARPLRPRAR